MNRSATTVLALLAIVFCLGAERSRRPVRWMPAIAPEAATMSFSFVPMGGALLSPPGSNAGYLDLGRVSLVSSSDGDVAVVPRKDGFVVTTTVGISVADASGRGRAATLMAAYPPRIGTTIRVNGVKLDGVPRVVSAHLVAGTVTKHKLEVEVTGEITEAQPTLLSTIQFTLIPE